MIIIQASYTLEGKVLETVEHIKYFGEVISSDLRWYRILSAIFALELAGSFTFLDDPQDVEKAAYK